MLPLQKVRTICGILFVALDSADEIGSDVSGVLGVEAGAAVDPGLLVSAGSDGNAGFLQEVDDGLLVFHGLCLEPYTGFLHRFIDDDALFFRELLPDNFGNKNDGGADYMLRLVDILSLFVPVVA